MNNEDRLCRAVEQAQAKRWEPEDNPDTAYCEHCGQGVGIDSDKYVAGGRFYCSRECYDEDE